MVHKFDNIDRKNGLIRGESDEYGVITVPDEDWDEIDDFEGNWEQITGTIIQNVYERNGSPSEQDLQLDYETVVSILREEGIVNFDAGPEEDDSLVESEEQRKAELLIEFLIDQGVYDIEGNQVVVLQGVTPDASKYVKFNWSKFLTVTADRLQEVVTRATEMKQDIADYYDDIGVNEIDPNEPKRKLLQDLEDITGAETEEDLQPKRITADGRIIPPDSVHDRDRYEYKKKLRRLEAWNVTGTRAPEQEHEVDPVKQLGVYIDELEIYQERFRDLEKDMRQKSIPQIVDIHGVQKDLRDALNIANDSGLMGERAMGDEQEVGNMISEVAAESGYEVGSREETIPDEDVPSGEIEPSDEDVITEGADETSEPETVDSSDGSTESGDGWGFEDIAGSLADEDDG